MNTYIIIFLLVISLLLTGTVNAEENNDKVVGLVLSGGAAWGLAHIGVLEVLSENDIKIDLISGTSAGAIIGSFYAGGTTPEEMIEIASGIRWRHFLNPVIADLGLFSPSGIEKYIKSELKIDQFDKLPIKFAVIAADLESGDEIIINEGSISSAVSASSAIPVIFKPVKNKDRLLVDGGIVNNLPVNLAKEMGADIIIAVDVTGVFSFRETPDSKLEAGIRAYNILQRSQVDASQADILIEPDLTGIRGIDFKSYEKIIKKGREAAEKVLPDIINLLGKE